jgi:MurNAc alpha-1-phosphate uridylyltransferase
MSKPKVRVPETAMVLAAGLGERMRPITDSLPKPMIEIQGRSLIRRILDSLGAVGVKRAVVNLHHLGEQLEAHLADRKKPKILFSHEEQRLDTGGGLARARSLLGEAPIFVINGDVLWLDGRMPALKRLAAAWDPARMSALLLVHPTAFAVGYEGLGDFFLSPLGELRRRREREVAPFVYAGIQILDPALLDDPPSEVFSANLVFDRAAHAKRLWGLRHDGEWFHVGTPGALREAEDAMHHLTVHAVQR